MFVIPTGIIAFLMRSPRRLGLLENVENPLAFRTTGATLFIEEFGSFTCGELFVGLGSLNDPELSKL